MDEKKPCARCDRPIDPYARICPFCNWDQTSATPPPVEQPASATAGYIPPQESNWRRHALFIGGGILVLVASFFVGALINSDDTPENAPTPVTDEIGQQENVARTRRADVTLVPVSDGGMPASELPITSAPIANPAEGVPTEYQRSDATAVSSVEYAALAQRAEAERKAQQRMVDPRSITGPAYAQAPVRRAPDPVVPPPMTSGSQEPLTDRESDREVDARDREPARVVERTRPVPQHQPLPSITVSEPVTARLELTIGANGRVTAVRIKNSIPGKTAELIAAVQSWRFKPATENGVPVSAPFNVDISFNP